MIRASSEITTPRRATPRWWAIALVELAGLGAACWLFVVAAIMLPEYGFFGVENDPASRRAGALAAIAFGPAVLSGPLFVAVVRRDGRWGWSAGGVAVAVSTTLLLLASGS